MLAPFGTSPETADNKNSFENRDVNNATAGKMSDLVRNYVDGIKFIAQNMSDNGRMIFAGCLSGSHDYGDESFAANFGKLIQTFNKNVTVYFPKGMTHLGAIFPSPGQDVWRGIAIPFDTPFSKTPNQEWAEYSHGNLYTERNSAVLHKQGKAVTF